MAFPSLDRRIESHKELVENLRIGRYWEIPQTGESTTESPKSGQISLTPEALGDMLSVIGR